jgi:hypothetical protein
MRSGQIWVATEEMVAMVALVGAGNSFGRRTRQDLN